MSPLLAVTREGRMGRGARKWNGFFSRGSLAFEISRLFGIRRA
jgi:hypothetical protein